MKRVFLTIILSLYSLTLFAQWNVLSPRPTPNAVYAGSATSANHFVGVTDQGEAVVTFDGGTTWQINPIGGNGIYRGVYFTDDNNGWAVGSFVERLHKTTDGGITWTHQPNAPDTTKYGVYFVDNNIGWTVGFNGLIAKTTNGGELWFSQSNTSITNKTLYGVWAIDANNVFVVGNDNTLIKSTDGGSTWTMLPAIFSSLTDYRRIFFLDNMNGYLVGERSSIAKTTDGGATWSIVNGPAGTVVLWGVDFNSAGTIGVACGGSGKVYRSTNSGSSWSEVSVITSTTVTFYSVEFGSDDAVYLSGSRGYLMKSTDAGATFTYAGYRFVDQTLKDVSFADNNNGYIVGTLGLLARSTDGGLTFTQQSSTWTGDINEISAPLAQVAFAACDDGMVLRTTNGGTTWDLLNTALGTGVELLGIDFLTNTTGYVAGSNGKVVKTTDAGNTWIDVSIPTTSLLWDMDFVDQNIGWVVGTGEKIFGTKDGGVTWLEQYSGGGLGSYGVSFIDAMHGIVSGTGGNTYYTDDGGSTWNSAITPPGNTVWGIHYVETANGTLALTACASGYVYKSEDGGRTWTLEPRFTINTFSDVAFSDAANAWFVGNSGIILKYTNPDNIPVELSSFTASLNGNDIILNWTTATETNNKGFEVERSRNQEIKNKNEEWERLLFLEGNGTATQPTSYTYTDKNLKPGSYRYRLKQIDFDGTTKYLELTDAVKVEMPAEFSLGQNYPNPFNPATKITFTIPVKSIVTLKIFDALGSEVLTLVNGEYEPGYYEIEFSAAGGVYNIASGIYFYKLTAGNFTDTKKMVVTK